ncbi:MAG: ribose-phosphate pyrophosphokinase [Planctomycetaceae bacterium]
MYDYLTILSGRAHPALAAEIAAYLNITLGRLECWNFPDGEIGVRLEENIRGRDVFIVQPTSPPVNESLMELLVLIDACRRASAERITAVMPYFGYARHDRKDAGRVPITAKLVANLIVEAGASRVLAMDLHAAQVQGFFDIPVDHLYAAPVLVEYFREKPIDNLMVVSPDAGGVERARAFAKRLRAPMAIIDKRREEVNVAEVMHVIGDVRDRHCLIIDDIIDTAGTLVKGADALLASGAAAVTACATHAVLSGPAIERIQNSRLSKVIFSNSIPLKDEAQKCDRIQTLSVAPLLAQAIRSIHEETSVSGLFV